MKHYVTLGIIFLVFSAGAAWAQEISRESLRKLAFESRFPRDQVVVSLPKDRGAEWALGQAPGPSSTASKNGKKWPLVIAGLALVGAGIALSATATETSSASFTDPFSGISSFVEETKAHNSKFWGGIGLTIGGGVVAVIGAIR